MKHWTTLSLGLVLIGSAAFWHPHQASGQAAGGWVTLFDGKALDNFTPVGDANWKVADGTVQADKGNGFLVSKNSYKDFQIRAEFWVDDDANSGIFIRCSDPQKLTSKSCYEVNVYDKRPDPSYGTGAIVGVAKVVPMPKAGGKWNVYEITAKGSQLIIVFNGQKTADVQDGTHAAGQFGLQYGGGVVKFRKVEIKQL